MPLRKWRPSTFWLTVSLTNPSLWSFTMAMWEGEGIAFNMGVTLPGWRATPLACISHKPGPVFRTVFMPLRKSGIPVLVLIPAPVNITQCLLSLTHFARRSIFCSSSSGESKNSFLSSSFLML